MNTDRDRDDYERWQRYGSERGWFEKMGDKVRSWFGDDEAERRRRMDETHERGSEPMYRDPRPSYNEPPHRNAPFTNPQYGQQYSHRPGNYGSVEYGSPTTFSGHPEHFGDQPWEQPRSEWYGGRMPRTEDHTRWQTSGHREETRMGNQPSYGNRFYGHSGETFAGRGPRGYKRSDERIKDDVCEHLTMHPEVDASEIEVQVVNGEVTITGMVHSRWEKRRSEEIAEDVYGVNNVHNNLRVGMQQPETTPQRSTEDKILNRPR